MIMTNQKPLNSNIFLVTKSTESFLAQYGLVHKYKHKIGVSIMLKKCI